MQIDVGIIGGTGIGERLAKLGGTPYHLPTSSGLFRGRVVSHAGLNLLVCSRHSAGHKVPPHRVNYSAIALGMKASGVRACLATAAVGSLRADWGPGTLVACSDFLDLSGRRNTLFDQTVVHQDFSDPFGPISRRAILEAGSNRGCTIQPRGTYFSLNGPRYETPFEIGLYKSWGADVVGMTAGSEAILMREANVDYGCMAIVTNLAAGIAPDPLSHEEVVEEMQRSGELAVSVLLEAAQLIAKTP